MGRHLYELTWDSGWQVQSPHRHAGGSGGRGASQIVKRSLGGSPKVQGDLWIGTRKTCKVSFKTVVRPICMRWFLWLL